MRKDRFTSAVSHILQKDQRFDGDAYYFLRDCLDYTLKDLRKGELPEHRHVSGNELLDGVREFALREFGSMSLPVLNAWGIRSGRDIGNMVFNLVEEKAFGKSEEDHISDFDNWMTFEEAFVNPFRPQRSVLARQILANEDKAPALQWVRSGPKPATTSEA